jgi:hypothetical protein
MKCESATAARAAAATHLLQHLHHALLALLLALRDRLAALLERLRALLECLRDLGVGRLRARIDAASDDGLERVRLDRFELELGEVDRCETFRVHGDHA